MAEKNAGLRIRVEEALRDAFVEACQANHIPAAQVIRTFMRDYIAAQDQPNNGAINSPHTRKSRGSPPSPRYRWKKGE
jgi:antitoxin component of RelBE/YafQ-DinJ toxin-antitoxin module